MRTAAGLTAALTIPQSPFPIPRYRSTTRIGRVGLQLYTLRDKMKSDVEGTLARVAETGYREVEFAGYFDKTPAQIRHILDAHGLVSPSAHVPYESMASGWSKVLDDAHVVGHRYITVAWIPQEVRPDLDGWKRVADQFTQAGEACRAAGIQFCFHNHNYEFTPMHGQLPYDVLLAAADAKLVQMEMDLYWISSAGQDPLPYFAKYPGRFPMVHVKDMGPAPAHKMMDVGQGIIDWKKIFAQSAQAGIRHYFVEHDEPADGFNDIKVSYNYLKTLEF
ncbi:MAG TPA: sugar phosphate isomerase/epimerase [Gemmatimonadales bacterium]